MLTKETINVSVGRKRPAEKASKEEQPRKKARHSCLACKTRKTKCIGFETGTCRYCESTGAPCEASLKSRKRPFYQVSSEVFEHTTKLLRRFVSEEELPDLTIDNIRAVFAKLDGGLPLAPTAQDDPVPHEAHRSHGAAIRSRHSAKSSGDAPALPRDNPAEEEPSGPQETMELDEHPLLQEELGCMALDSLHKYRYVGVDSSIRWNHAARIALGPQVTVDPKIVPPLCTGLLPPKTPQSVVNGRKLPKDIYLPRRQLCMRYFRRFCDQIHTMYSFYPSEQLYAQLDKTLQDGGATASAQWLCSLYSIFALGSMRSREQVQSSRGLPPDEKDASQYLEMAKELSSKVADEADIESVRAFGLLSLACYGLCYSISAYLHLGTAVQIGFSLGLHRDVAPKGQDPVERDRGRQLWWTIYVLDYEVANRWGYPSVIDERTSFMKYPHAGDQISFPTLDMPSGYQYFSVSLVRLRKQINHDCFLEPAHVGRRLPIKRVTHSLGALKKWLDGMPIHLHWDSVLPPQHRRSVAILNLRYCISVIFITRPFLLFSVTRPSMVNSPAKRKLYDDLSATCIACSERACRILERMSEDETLASLTLFDVGCIGEVTWVFILALKRNVTLEHQNMLRTCRDLLDSMERVGWSERLVPEFEARICESRLLDVPAAPLPKDPLLHNVEIAPTMGHAQVDLSFPGYGPGDIPFSEDLLSTMNFDFEGSPSLDVYETLGFDATSGLMDMFTDATLSGSNFYSFNVDGFNAEPQ